MDFDDKEIIRHLDQYQREALKTAGDHGGYESRLLYGGVSLADESGEVLGKIKKQVWHGYARNADSIGEELGDVLWSLAYLARQLGFSLSQIATMNIEKLKTRYPEGFKKGGGIRVVEPTPPVEDPAED